MSWKIRHTQLQGRMAFCVHTKSAAVSVYEFHVETAENCACEELFEGPFFRTSKQNLKNQFWTVKYMGNWDSVMFLQSVLEIIGPCK